MHFHLPKPLHGWREFAGEVGIIVVGVLIALAAEQVVEGLSWHKKVERAEAAMRIELAEDDGPQAYGRVLIGACLDQQLARIQDGAGRASADQLRQWIADYAPPFRTWDSEAWKAVVASDVGSHMGPDRLIEWSAPYRMMPNLTDRNSDETELANELHEALAPSGAVSAADAAVVRRTASRLRILNQRMVRGSQLLLVRSNAIGAAIPAQIQRTLVTRARAIYGGCVHVPDLNAAPVAQALDANLRTLTQKLN